MSVWVNKRDFNIMDSATIQWPARPDLRGTVRRKQTELAALTKEQFAVLGGWLEAGVHNHEIVARTGLGWATVAGIRAHWRGLAWEKRTNMVAGTIVKLALPKQEAAALSHFIDDRIALDATDDCSHDIWQSIGAELRSQMEAPVPLHGKTLF